MDHLIKNMFLKCFDCFGPCIVDRYADIKFFQNIEGDDNTVCNFIKIIVKLP